MKWVASGQPRSTGSCVGGAGNTAVILNVQKPSTYVSKGAVDMALVVGGTGNTAVVLNVHEPSEFTGAVD